MIREKMLRTLFLFLCCLSSGCLQEQDDFEQIARFRPGDKYFTASLKSLHFRIETSDIARIDTIFTQLIKKKGIPVTARGCKNGIYTGESPYDAYDYKHVITLEIRNEKIISVDYDEVNKKGVGKQHDEKYCENMSVSGTTPAIAYPVYEKALLGKQDFQKLDIVTGASYSLYRFQYAAMIALMKASL